MEQVKKQVQLANQSRASQKNGQNDLENNGERNQQIDELDLQIDERKQSIDEPNQAQNSQPDQEDNQPQLLDSEPNHQQNLSQSQENQNTNAQVVVKIEGQYFSYQTNSDESLALVQGQCKSFVSKKQQRQRDIDQFQHYPFVQIAKHFRNKTYNNAEEVRSPETLDSALQYLKQNFMITILNDEKKITKILTGEKRKKQIVEQRLHNNEQQLLKQKRLQKILLLMKKQTQLAKKRLKPMIVNEQYMLGKYLKNNTQQKQIRKQSSQSQQKSQKQQNGNILQFGIPQSLVPFIQSRINAIRCQLYAQGIIFPRLMIQLLKCQILLYILQQNQYQNIGFKQLLNQQLSLRGLDIILDKSIKSKLINNQQFYTYYIQALTIAIFRVKTKEFGKLLEQHQTILQDPTLIKYLKIRFQMQRGNYQRYFQTLRDQTNVLVRCLLLTHLNKMRKRLCDVLISAKIDVKKGWLAVLLGFKLKQQQNNQIVNLNKDLTFISDLVKAGAVQSKRKQLKNWIKVQQLYYEMINNKKIIV